MLHNLEGSIRRLMTDHPDDRASALALTAHYHSLLREWADT
jgi:predicted 2-oxoglutarate/Fe(II)-dependent dioxygenase YbiX